MKRIYFLFVVVLAMMSSCGGKKEAPAKGEQLMFQIESVDSVTGLQRMRVARVDKLIVCNGKKYRLFIERAPSDSLPNVRTALGLFADNHAVVRISREDGRRIFSKVFTKHTFTQFLLPGNFPRYILEGVVFDEEKTRTGKNIVLAASVGFPQTDDMYVPFSITVTPDGRMTILKNEDLEELPPTTLNDSLN